MEKIIYYIESHYLIKKGIVRKTIGNRCIIETETGGITLQKSRLFQTEEAAEKKVKATGRSPQYAYDRYTEKQPTENYHVKSAAAKFGKK